MNGEWNDNNGDDWWSIDTKDYNLAVPSFVILFVIGKIIVKSTHNSNKKQMTNKLLMKQLVNVLFNCHNIFHVEMKILLINSGIKMSINKWYNEKTQCNMIEEIFNKIIFSQFETQCYQLIIMSIPIEFVLFCIIGIEIGLINIFFQIIFGNQDENVFDKYENDCNDCKLILSTTKTPDFAPQPISIINKTDNEIDKINVNYCVFGVCLYGNNNDIEIIAGMLYTRNVIVLFHIVNFFFVFFFVILFEL